MVTMSSLINSHTWHMPVPTTEARNSPNSPQLAFNRCSFFAPMFASVALQFMKGCLVKRHYLPVIDLFMLNLRQHLFGTILLSCIYGDRVNYLFCQNLNPAQLPVTCCAKRSMHHPRSHTRVSNYICGLD